jgi:glycosyltransferase involved in cell wall biosynthesis
MAQKLISVITINLNDAPGLQSTINSVRAHDDSLYEHIIIDGGSSDGSVQIIKKLAPGFSFWSSEPDTGVYDAQNKGIKQARGEFLLFLNSGDTVNDGVFRQFSTFKDQHKKAVIYGNSNILKADGTHEKLVPPDNLDLNFWYRNTLNHQAVFFRRDLFERYGPYDTKYRFSADLDLLVRIFKKEPSAFVHFDAFVCHYAETGISARPENYESIIREKEQIVQSHFTADEFKAAKRNFLKQQSFKTRYRIFISERPFLKRMVSLFKK